MKSISDICDYQNDGAKITAPGKFEGEPVFAPYFWNLALEGFADEDDGSSYFFKIDANDRATIPGLAEWLGPKCSNLRLMEDSQGFVHCY